MIDLVPESDHTLAAIPNCSLVKDQTLLPQPVRVLAIPIYIGMSLDSESSAYVIFSDQAGNGSQCFSFVKSLACDLTRWLEPLSDPFASLVFHIQLP